MNESLGNIQKVFEDDFITTLKCLGDFKTCDDIIQSSLISFQLFVVDKASGNNATLKHFDISGSTYEPVGKM